MGRGPDGPDRSGGGSGRAGGYLARARPPGAARGGAAVGPAGSDDLFVRRP